MIYKKHLLILILIVAAQAACLAGRHSFNTYSVENGLANNSVGAIIQDGAGFIWLGTRGGLCRFDGTAFMTVDLPSVNALRQTAGRHGRRAFHMGQAHRNIFPLLS